MGMPSQQFAVTQSSISEEACPSPRSVARICDSAKNAGQSSLPRYLREIQRFPMLEPRDEYTLATHWREHGDRDAAHKLITSHLRLVAKIAMGYRGYGLPISEMISEGNIGLMQAVKRFQPERVSASPPTRCGGSGPRSRDTSCAPGRW
jgi:DNA-directed RNA polymerase sigma subunit (sigma70/sigma32)